MADNTDRNFTDRGEHNQRKGQQLHKQDQQQRYGYRGAPETRQWGENNFFHTGPSPRGAQDRDPGRSQNPSGYNNRPASYEQQNQSNHYGTSQNSPYRNERSHINHGDNYGSSNYQSNQNNQGSANAGGSRHGNFSDQSDQRNNLYREGPGSSSRYKETDFRYGSGSHNWYQEGRYTADNEDERNRDGRGFMDRVKDTWNDIWHSDDPDYRTNNTNNRQDYYDNQRHVPQNTSRNFNRGYESGPRWADETDSGNDSYYQNNDPSRR
ncbi:hypothetical protein [Pontibacter arcticus]|uniref:Uncharacterized protein n=1 Tax=Pontibacter arcticus TaxID=2080288 RepID=A0A364RIB0_9BACT|nr:hypothetical protein [Pontibacter arcticus]RAU84015.1 hypothetical protein DP923_02855 [Pontibacter arcticus]